LAKAGDWENIPANILVRNYNSLRNIHKDFSRPTETIKQNFLFWGKTGTGKTRKAYEEAKDIEDIPYWKDPTSKWWDGYQGQKCVIMDDFDGGIAISYLLRWMDRYPIDGEIKGGRVPLKYEYFYITSNKTVYEWYPKCKSDQNEALIRRFTLENIIYFDGQKENVGQLFENINLNIKE